MMYHHLICPYGHFAIGRPKCVAGKSPQCLKVDCRIPYGVRLAAHKASQFSSAAFFTGYPLTLQWLTPSNGTKLFRKCALMWNNFRSENLTILHPSYCPLVCRIMYSLSLCTQIAFHLFIRTHDWTTFRVMIVWGLVNPIVTLGQSPRAHVPILCFTRSKATLLASAEKANKQHTNVFGIKRNGEMSMKHMFSAAIRISIADFVLVFGLCMPRHVCALDSQ